VLTYFSHFTRADVLDMTLKERRWHVERVAKQVERTGPSR
jgi:hypothetical protein